MTTINRYYLKYGTEGLNDLAVRANTKLSYLQQLNYVLTKEPSLKLAKRLVEHSAGELTLEGLANPEKLLIREARARAEKAKALEEKEKARAEKAKSRGSRVKQRDAKAASRCTL